MAITLIIEDGTGKVDANSYIDVAAAEAYLENSGRLGTWQNIGEELRKSVLIQGTDYLDQTYRRRYKGVRFSSAQRLEWPREDVFDELGEELDVADIPEAIGQAVVEYAVEAISGPLAPTPTVDETGRTVLQKRERVDVLEESTTYRDRATPAFKRFPRAELVIRRWLKRTGTLTLRAS